MKTTALLLSVFACVAFARADVKLPAIFSNHMVVQADASVPVWSWAEPGEERDRILPPLSQQKMNNEVNE